MQPIVLIGDVGTLLGYEFNNINNKTNNSTLKDDNWELIQLGLLLLNSYLSNVPTSPIRLLVSLATQKIPDLLQIILYQISIKKHQSKIPDLKEIKSQIADVFVKPNSMMVFETSDLLQIILYQISIKKYQTSDCKSKISDLM